MLIGGAGMTLIGQAVLLVEGMRARDSAAAGAEPRPPSPPCIVRLRRVGLMGGLLIGLSTFQAEFDFGVPQFRLVLPAGADRRSPPVALVCARLWIGRGARSAPPLFFIAIRGGVSLIVGAGVRRDRRRILPLYLAEAAVRRAGGAARSLAGRWRSARSRAC